MAENIVITEGEAPLLTFHAKEWLPGGDKDPYSLAAVTAARFYTKADPDDVAKVFEYTLASGAIAIVDDGTDPADEYSILTVQMSAADTGIPQTLYYWLFVDKGASRSDCIKRGFLEIENA